MKKIMSGVAQSVVEQLTNRALHDAKLREKDAETYVKKYMKVALFLFKEEIPHTTKFEKLIDIICSWSLIYAILLRLGTRMLRIEARLQLPNLCI